MYDVLPMKQI